MDSLAIVLRLRHENFIWNFSDCPGECLVNDWRPVGECDCEYGRRPIRKKKVGIFHDMVLAISNPLCYVASFLSLDQGLLVIAWNSCVILSFKGPVDRMFIGFLCVP